jgi:hydrogenase maturation protein HypF
MHPSYSYNKRNVATTSRLKVVIRGVVQGVGFRPFVYRLATQMKLAGWISNTSQGVFIEVEGGVEKLQTFLLRIQREKPPISFIQSLEPSWLDPIGYTDFSIRESRDEGKKTTLVLPDIATCPQCLDDIFDPDNRRHLYPFTNCTNCGPRFTIIESLPYDRRNTSMRRFEMCPECRREYEDPGNRRFHAQPNACPICGPHVELWNPKGEQRSSNLYAVLEAVDAIRSGKIVAVKGLGGFHLIADAGNEDVVARLRERKHREEKPFALMYPSLTQIKEDCFVSDSEERLLLSPESPIVLLRRKNGGPSIGVGITLARLAANLAPSNPYLGVMLPYTPLHHILMRELRVPVIATSGNLSDEPICIDEHEALGRLGSIADMFLVHDRPIVRHVDDSIVRIVLGRELVLRRARGYAPLPVMMMRSLERPTLAVGAHLKNTVAVANGANVIISQHIGDLETKESFDAFKRATTDVAGLYEIESPGIVCDMHPDYLSSKYAHDKVRNVAEVQHHYAHIASCMAENEIEGPVLGVAWDGTGYGLDGSVWGGEFLVTNETSFERRASFLQFRLPGGDTAIKEPRRTALGVLSELMGESLFFDHDSTVLRAFKAQELTVIRQMLAKGLNAPKTSSVGRLFDAVASIIGLRQIVRFEGQAAMELEFLTSGDSTDESYPFGWLASETEPGLLLANWKPLIQGILDDLNNSCDAAHISKKFHNSLVQIVLDVARRTNLERVVLSGGCFQNSYLTEHCVESLRELGFRPYWHQRIPPNDGGISLGQIYALARLEWKNSSRRRAEATAEIGK